MERIAMSQEERDRLEWLKRAKDRVISQRKAAQNMGVSDRWVRKLLQRMKSEGDGVVVHRLRGRASNRKIEASIQAQALQILKQPEWHDFGPTFASEQLAKRHQIEVSDETLRAWMIRAGLWQSRSRKLEAVHCLRPRRSAFGELVQWDTSTHDWLEGRGPVRYLVRLIDDATSWSWGRFVERDATPFNMAVLWEYLEQHGRMVDVYTDRHAMFAVTPRAGESQAERLAADRLTQIGRGLRELGIGWIAAQSPPAKGRVERSFATDQDRLVKHLRLAQVATLEAANAFLETEYWPEWNQRFAKPVAEFPNQHRPLTPYLDLADPVPRRTARDWQRPHLFLRRPALPDCALRGASRYAAPAAACGTAAERGLEGLLSGPLSGHRRVRRPRGRNRAGADQTGTQGSQRGS